MSEIRINRLREIADVIADGNAGSLIMSIPTDLDHDADLVIDWAAGRITELEQRNAELEAVLREALSALQPCPEKHQINMAIESITNVLRERT